MTTFQAVISEGKIAVFRNDQHGSVCEAICRNLAHALSTINERVIPGDVMTVYSGERRVWSVEFPDGPMTTEWVLHYTRLLARMRGVCEGVGVRS